MIRSFRHNGLPELFARGASGKVRADLRERVLHRLDALDAAADLSQLDVPGFDFQALRGHKPPRYTLHVNGPWCITFEWSAGGVLRVDLEQYH